jgi:hypothetical protein
LELSKPGLVDALRHSYTEDAPSDYSVWLDRNISHYDPIFRSWRLRAGGPQTSRSFYSFKCGDDRCVHYIYGFYTREDRDNHTREHVSASKRDSALSMGNTPPLPFPDYSDHRTLSTGDFSKTQSAIQLPKPTPATVAATTSPSATVYLAPLSTTNQSRDRKDSLLSYSFASDYPGPGRGSLDSEVDPLLPPLKRSRVGQSRLQSIEELKLLRDVGPCLRCKVQMKAVRLSHLENNGAAS